MYNFIAAALLATILAGCAVAPPSFAAGDPLTSDPVSIDAENPPTTKAVSVKARDGSRMSGRFLLANGAGPHPTILLLHGFPGNETNLDIAQMLRRAGYNVLFLHYRGAWGSEGEYSIAHIVEDAASAVSFLRSGGEPRVDAGRIILLGHSMGGMTALLTAEADPAINCVAAWAPADGPGFAAALGDPATGAEYANYVDDLFVLHGLTGANFIAEFRDNTRDFDVIAKAAGLKGKSVLLVGAREDSVLPIAAFYDRLDAAFGADAQIRLTSMVLEGDHGFSWTRFALARATLDFLDANCR